MMGLFVVYLIILCLYLALAYFAAKFTYRITRSAAASILVLIVPIAFIAVFAIRAVNDEEEDVPFHKRADTASDDPQLMEPLSHLKNTNDD